MCEELILILGRLGDNVFRIRKMKGISQEELALVTWISANYISKLERGRINPSLRILRKLCRRLHVRMRDLFKGI